MGKKRFSREGIFWFFGITLYSVFVFFILLAGNKDAFYTDDNLMQWGPVIRTAFDEIFGGEGIPHWNFYQYKGIDIFSSGYYGLLNPFMYLSYAISRFVFSYELETLIIYMWLMYWLGLLMMRRLLDDLSLSRGTVIVSLAAYSTAVIFFLYAYYYFTFNNFFYVPLFILVMLRTRRSKINWFVPGIILSFSLLLGHIQYTVYYVMMYCILQVVFAVQDKNWKPVIAMLVNTGLFAGLSFALILQLYSVSLDRSEIFALSDFWMRPVNIVNIFNPFSTLMLHNIPVKSGEIFQRNIGLGIHSWLALLMLLPVGRKAVQYLENFLFDRDSFIYRKEGDKEVRKIRHIIVTVIIDTSLCLLVTLLVKSVTDYSLIEVIAYAVFTLGAVIASAVSMRSGKDFMISPKIVHIAVFAFSVLLSFYFTFFAYIAAIAGYTVWCVKYGGIENCSETKRVLHAFMFAAFFFVLYTTGSGIALILSKLPFIGTFRFLYKSVFIYIPIFIACGAYQLDRIPRLKKRLYAVSVGCSALLLVNIGYMFYSGLHPFIYNDFFEYIDYRRTEQEVTRRIEDTKIDSNYRFMTFGNPDVYRPPFELDLEELEKMNAANQLYNIWEFAASICPYGLTRNYNTAYGLFSLSGYDNVFTMKSLEQSDMLLSSSSEDYMEGLVNHPEEFIEYADDPEDLKKFEAQIIENGVRYVLIPENAEVISAFEETVGLCEKLKIIRSEHWYRNYLLYEIDGVRPICSYDGTEKLPMESSLDSLRFSTAFTESTPVTIAMTYEPHYKLLLTDEAGSVSELELSEDPSGYVTTEIPAGSYDVEFCYKNRIMDLAVVMALVTALLTLASVILVSRSRVDYL